MFHLSIRTFWVLSLTGSLFSSSSTLTPAKHREEKVLITHFHPLRLLLSRCRSGQQDRVPSVNRLLVPHACREARTWSRRRVCFGHCKVRGSAGCDRHRRFRPPRTAAQPVLTRRWKLREIVICQGLLTGRRQSWTGGLRSQQDPTCRRLCPPARPEAGTGRWARSSAVAAPCARGLSRPPELTAEESGDSERARRRGEAPREACSSRGFPGGASLCEPRCSASSKCRRVPGCALPVLARNQCRRARSLCPSRG